MFPVADHDCRDVLFINTKHVILLQCFELSKDLSCTGVQFCFKILDYLTRECEIIFFLNSSTWYFKTSKCAKTWKKNVLLLG